MGGGSRVGRNGSVYYVNIPVQMFCAMDTNGRISPLRFRYETKEHTVETVRVERVIEQGEGHFVGLREKQYICAVEMYDRQRIVEVRYNMDSQKWRISRILS